MNDDNYVMENNIHRQAASSPSSFSVSVRIGSTAEFGHNCSLLACRQDTEFHLQEQTSNTAFCEAIRGLHWIIYQHQEMDRLLRRLFFKFKGELNV